MKKNTLLIIVLLFFLTGYSQLSEEGFENNGTALPPGWSKVNVAGPIQSWNVIAGNPGTPAYEGNHLAYISTESMPDGELTEDWLITPQFTLPSFPRLRFYSRLMLALDQGSTYKVMITNGDPADLDGYEEVETWTEFQINPVQTDYIEKLVDLPEDYIGPQVYIAFVTMGDNGDRWLIDNVEVFEQCPAPSNLDTGLITDDTAELTWDNPAGITTWEIELLPVTSTTTGSGIIYNGELPYIAQGLTPYTEYKYFVRSVCSGESSAWIGPIQFTTVGEGDNCDAPIVINNLPFSTDDNTSNYADTYEGLPGGDSCGNNGAYFLQGNDVVYQYTADFTGTISFNLTASSNTGVFIYADCDDIGTDCIAGSVTPWTGTTTSIPAFEITAGQTYYILISSQPDTTPFSLIIQEVSCDPPVGLPVGDTDFTSTELSWTNPTGADTWEIVIQAPGAGIPQGSGVTVTTNTDYPANGLNPGTPYEYYVRSECNDGSFSAWAGPYLFNTTICEPSEQCEYTFIMSNYTGSGWMDNTMTVSQNGITLAVLNPMFDFGVIEVTETVALCPDIPVQIYWNEGGFDPQFIGLTVKNSFGQTVYTKPAGEGDQNSLLYEGEVVCDAVSCLTPDDLTAANITFTSAELSWDSGATGQWEYYIVEAGEPAPDNTTPGIATDENPLTVEGLTQGTNYEYYVRMFCDDGTFTEWSEPYAFSTGFCAPENQCDYTFILSSEWGPGYIGHTMTISQNGINVAVLGPQFTTGTEMTVTVPLCNNMPFEMFWNTGGFSGDIGLSIINPFNQTIYAMDGTQIPGTLLYSGEVDCDVPACIPPADLTAGNPTITTIDLGWEGLITGSWEYYIVEAGEPAPTPATTGVTTATNPVTAGGLTAATNYEYYVRMICEGGTTSEWAGPMTFNTTVCEPGDQCLFTFEMTSEQGFGWEDNTMTITQAGITIATIGPEFTFGNSGTVQIPLCADETVEIFWNSDGWGIPDDKGLMVYSPYMEVLFTKPAGTGEQGTTIFTGTFSCEAPPCPKPQQLTAADITSESALLGWTEMGSATNWEVVVLPIGSPEPTGTGTPVTANSYLFEDVAAGTAYSFYVRSICGGAGNSTWAGPFNFFVPAENDDCATATTLAVNGGMDCIQYRSAVMNGSTSTGITSSCTWTAPFQDVWFEFVATNENHGIRLSNQTGEVLPFHAVYSGSCDNLTEIACNYESTGSTLTGLAVGETYWIQVYIDGGTFEINSIVSFDICVYTPVGTSIILDQEPTVEEIVNDVLISSECGQVSNITFNTGTNHGVASNGIAYFNRGTTNFPLEEGLLLTSGNAMQALAPNMTTMGNGPLGEGDYWPGDDQLFDYIISQGLPSISHLQATIVEFDFVPVTNRIKFPFVFASEEYNGTDQCLRSDAFAFFLSTNGEEPVNLAVIPDTTIPVTSLTIRDAAYLDPNWEFSCESANEEYFDKYYGPFNGLDPMTAPMNFNGHTVVMYAEADVIPGQTYHLKMVIADEYTTALDSGVFIGPFDIGNVDLGADLTIAGGSALCEGEEYTIESGLDPDLYTFTWLQGDDVIEGETGANLTVTGSGEYTVEAQYLATTCMARDSITIEYYPSVEDETQSPSDLTVCAATDTAQFDLTQNNTIIAGANTGDYNISYHLTPADAESGNGDLASPYTNISNPQAVYARVENIATGCYTVYSFTLSVLPQYTADVLPDVTRCDSFVLPELSANNNYFTGTNGTGTTLNAGDTVTSSQLIYIFAQSETTPGCSSESSFTVTIGPTPAFSLGGPYVVCNAGSILIEVEPENFDLEDANFEWTYEGTVQPGTDSSIQPIGFGTYQVTVTIGECFFTQSVEVTQDPDSIDIEITEDCTDGVYTLQALPVNEDADIIITGYSWTGPEGFTESTQNIVPDALGQYFVTVTTENGCTGDAGLNVTSVICDIPRGVSPNGDGINDSFDLSALSVSKLSIFNRYGSKVYSFEGNYADQWHGQADNGNELPTGTYYYMIESFNGETKTGWVYINYEE